jgi:hypothetical protein
MNELLFSYAIQYERCPVKKPSFEHDFLDDGGNGPQGN